MPFVSWMFAFLTFLVADCELWKPVGLCPLHPGGLTPAQTPWFQMEGQGGEISTSDRMTSLD